jgi:hypothetical protein
VTARNVLKWSQQLLSTLLVVHANYMCVGDFTLEDVCLDSDRYVISALEQHKQLLFSNRDTPVDGPDYRAENDLHANIESDSDRNAWIDIHDKVLAFKSSQKPRQPLITAARSLSPPKDKSRASSPSKAPPTKLVDTSSSSSVVSSVASSAVELATISVPDEATDASRQSSSPIRRPLQHQHKSASSSYSSDSLSVISTIPPAAVRAPSNAFDRQLLLQYDTKKTGSCTVQ